MRPATPTLKAAVETSHRPVVRVDVLVNGVTLRTIDTVIDGSVTLDATANVRGRVDLTIVDDGTRDLIPTAVDDPLAPYGNEVRVWRGIEGELISLGVFRIDNPRVSEEGGMPTIQITGQDRSARIIDARFEAPYEVNAGGIGGGVGAGVPVTDAILDVITDVYPDVQTNFVQTDATTGVVVAEAQDDRWEFASKLALGAGMRLFFDGDGVLTLAPEVASGVATVELVEGDSGVLVTASREWTREGARNVIVATGENVGEAAPARGIAQDDDPLSPTYVYGPFGRVVGFYSSPVLTTDAQARDAAQTILARSTGTTQRVEFGSLVLPYLEPGDVARITRHRIGINELHVLDGLTIPLATGGVMSGRTRAVSGSVYEPPATGEVAVPLPGDALLFADTVLASSTALSSVGVAA